MSRSRNIKPGFFKNDRLAECDPLARILFQGLWCEADREGRLENRPKRLKAECLPYDDCDITALLNQLALRGFIVLYVVDGVSYIAIPEFCKHQNPHMKEAASAIPAPDKSGASPVQSPDKNSSSPADSLLLIPVPIEKKELVAPPTAKRAPKADTGKRITADWQLTTEQIEWTRKKRPGVNLAEESEHFRDYWLSVSGAKARRTDWFLTWKTWTYNGKPNGKFQQPAAPPAAGNSPAKVETAESKAQAAADFARYAKELGYAN